MEVWFVLVPCVLATANFIFLTLAGKTQDLCAGAHLGSSRLAVRRWSLPCGSPTSYAQSTGFFLSACESLEYVCELSHFCIFVSFSVLRCITDSTNYLVFII